ncbi:hypothetical protein J5N97_001545 [Dioscorea zingiberensis]|uniref:Uncharacterized protein n=1 Tax=Dioscorea zingiberensis TaxID=325984 RepID=A0A9D5H332_9LILI|nr:hypothetical protein J5N97_001545 [Dioscorea zingiberensis]
MNEKLMVDVLKVGVSVGVKVCSPVKEERTLVKREEIRMAVEEVMGCGEEAEVRRKRVEELGEMTRRVVQESGSSFQDMDSLIEVLMEMKTWSAEPGYLRELLPDSAPKHPESLEDVLNGEDDLLTIIKITYDQTNDFVLSSHNTCRCVSKIIPGVTHWHGPAYFAYHPSNSSTAGLLGEILSAGFNTVGFSWVTSPTATELEEIVLDWLAKMLKAS